MTNSDKDVFIPIVPSVLGAMLMSKVSRQKEGFREDLISLVESDQVNLPEGNYLEQFKSSFVVANGFMEKWGVNYGHSSIKELDHLQMCIENRSRWFTEIIETLSNNTFWSYIEYSLRYNPPTEYVVPKELDDKLELKDKYIEFCEFCFESYRQLYKIMEEILKEKYSELSDSAVKKLAFENARNVLPLSVKSNMGVSTNMRAFSDGLSELFAHGIKNSEIDETAFLMKEEALKVSPGMVRHVEPSEYILAYIDSKYKLEDIDNEIKRKIYHSPEVRVMPALNFGKEIEIDEKVLALMNRFDQLPSDFNRVGKNVEILMSEAGHHQLIRHRALNIIPKFPNVDYGLLIPYEIVEALETDLGKKAESLMIKVYEKSCEIFDDFIKNGFLNLSPYVVLNANIRKVDFFGNLKGMAHFITIRTEEHAQDEIRFVAKEIEKEFLEFEKMYPGLKINRKNLK